ncbi:MAG TPA: radical SAM protein [Candidatus Binatia bacterium]|nr:radical SAM protein [Candidatus Binatia bacterium]
MAKNAATTESNFDILEGYFNKYPDVPKETILKQHMLSLGHWFSDAALDACEGALVKSYRLFSYDLVPMSYFKRNEHRRVPEHFVLINGPYDMRPVAIQTSLSPDSPYLIDIVDGRFVLAVDGHVVSHVRIPKTPDYYFQSLPDGTPYHEIVAFASFITIFRNCQYWGAKEECKFCDINENARQMKLSRDFTLTAPVKSVEDVVTVCEYVANDAKKIGAGQGFVLSGGSITKTLHSKSEADFYVPYIEAIKNIGSNPRITFEVNARPREEVKRYKTAGADHIHFNMEVWDKKLFPWINPGKAERVGWDNWVRWMEDAVEVFGNGMVQPSFVSGIEMAKPHGFKTVNEAVASATDCFEYLMSRAIMPRPQQWRREPATALCREAEQPPVPLDYYIQMTRNWYETYDKYRDRLPKFGTRKPGLLAERNLLGPVHGAYGDFAMLKENLFPEDVEERINRRSVPWENIEVGARVS